MIHVSHLTKSYGPRVAVNNISFDVAQGEIVGFLGPNGAGKSTTMKIITAFMPATEGTATVAGFDVFTSPLEVKKNVGYLPEIPPVYLDMEVRDYVQYVADLHDVPKAKMTKAINSSLDKTGLGDVQKRLIGNLSKGYRQRVGIAQALVHNPKVLILDEPTVGLDPKQIIEIRELIKGLKGEHTIILSTHILPEVNASCDRAIIIHQGQIVAQDHLDKLTKRNQITLEVRKITNDGIDAIKKIPGTSSVKKAGAKIYIETDSGTDEIKEKVAAAAVGSGMGLLEMTSGRASLEEVFIQLTTRDIRAN